FDPVLAAGGMIAFHVSGRALAEGERVRIVYGAGASGARVDRFAERDSPIWLAVDGDGDGVRALLQDSPRVDVLAGGPARLLLIFPSTARPGSRVKLSVVVLDGLGNAGVELQDTIAVEDAAGLPLPKHLIPGQPLEVLVEKPGVYRVRAASANGLEAESNPLVVREGIPRILWGDLHGHSQLSDGTGTPEDYYAYARDIAALDLVALTDHDHWGMRFIDQNPEMWERIRRDARAFEEPGRFLALAGYEWTNWVHGHRHVLYFEEEGEILSALDPRYETPALLWKALEGHSAITVAHHSAGGPVSTDWSYLPDPTIEPVTEIVSVHGSSEASDSPGKIYSAVEGNFVRDVLDRGARFGFVGSGDSHDGHPGLAHLASPSGGLAAIFAEELTREAVLDALRARRAYATNGPRIWLRMWLDGEPMGSSVSPSGAAMQELRFAAAATAPVDRIDIVRSGSVVRSVPGNDRRDLSETIDLPCLTPGEYVYVRVVQSDGGAAWASPVYADRVDGHGASSSGATR
ncbi:MAG TPA: CehA/McbA family metallohydrolase, partial [Vicinamibacteria bacterium]|nr:CehA/McbA family metallohydrolase [Vicinamibacteria bacterium]